MADPATRDAGRGVFIAVEGVEGSGKTTQVRLLAERLRAAGREVIVAREPGSTPLGERIRETALRASDLDIPARSELFLMLAARAAFVEQIVRPTLAGGDIVLADRFDLSTLAYQGAGRGLPAAEVRQCNQFATGGLQPDLTVWLDIDPAEGAQRQHAAGKAPDRMERETLAFHRRVADAYRALASEVPGVVRADATGDIDTVHARVWTLVGARFPETFRPAGVTTAEPFDFRRKSGSSLS